MNFWTLDAVPAPAGNRIGFFRDFQWWKAATGKIGVFPHGILDFKHVFSSRAETCRCSEGGFHHQDKRVADFSRFLIGVHVEADSENCCSAFTLAPQMARIILAVQGGVA